MTDSGGRERRSRRGIEVTELVQGVSIGALVVVFLGALFLPGSSRAREPEFIQRGAAKELLSSVDSVNKSSGGLTLRVPLGPTYFVGGKVSLQLQLFYASKLWDSVDGNWHLIPDVDGSGPIFYDIFDVPHMAPSKNFTAGLGWRSSLGELIPFGSGPNSHARNRPTGGLEDNWIYIGPDGSTHAFYENLHQSLGSDDGVQYTRDGSRLRLQPGDDGNYLVEFPNGVVHEFAPIDSTVLEFRIVRIYDVFGGANKRDVNYLAITYDDSVPGELTQTITDARGRTWTLTYETWQAGRYLLNSAYDVYARDVTFRKLVKVEMPAFDSSTPAVYDFLYTNKSMRADCGIEWSKIVKPESFSEAELMPFLSTINMPEGESWSFDYYNDDTDDTDKIYNTWCRQGTLRKATLPTGGQLVYEYKKIAMPGYCTPRWAAGADHNAWVGGITPWVARRRYLDVGKEATAKVLAEWSYDYIFSYDIAEYTSSITLPLKCEKDQDGGWGTEGGQFGPDTHLFGSEILTTKVQDPLGDITLYFTGTNPSPVSRRDGGYDQWDYYAPYLKPEVRWEGFLILKDLRIGSDLLGTLVPWGGPEPIEDGGGRYLHKMEFDCDAAGKNCTKYRFTYHEYETEDNLLVGPVNTMTRSGMDLHRRLVSERVVTFRPGGGRFVVRTNYSDPDGLGHSRTVTVTENLQYSSDPVRSTTTHYNPGYDLTVDANHQPDWSTPWPVEESWPDDDNWVLDTYDYEDSVAGTDLERTEYFFDPDTGFLGKTRVLAEGTERSAHDLLTISDDSSTGTPDGLADGDGLVRFVLTAGGDVWANQKVGVGLDELENVSVPDKWIGEKYEYSYGIRSKTTATSFRGGSVVVSSAVPDSSTGLLKSTTDIAGATASYAYDGLGRLVSITRPATDSAGTATTTTESAVYSTTAGGRQKVTVTNNEQPDIWWAVVQDGFGRNVREETNQRDDTAEANTASPSFVRYDYGGNGLLRRSYSPSFDISVAGFVKSTQYDPDGRALLLETLGSDGVTEVSETSLAVDGGHKFTTTTSYQSDSGEATAIRKVWKDSAGKIVRVEEPSGANSAMIPTTYDYDAGGRLVSVSTEVKTGVFQTREFVYDGRGFLLEETHPENGTTLHWGYNALGKVGHTSNGGRTRTFRYDLLLNQLTEVRDGQGRPVIELYYPRTPLATVPHSKGRLFRAERHNYIGQRDRIISQVYHYDAAGRVKRLMTSGTDGFLAKQTYKYDLAGSLLSATLPWESKPGTTDVERRVSYQYVASQVDRITIANIDSGASTALPPVVIGDISYHPGGLAATLSGPGGTDAMTLDGTGLGRVGSYQVSNDAGDVLWDSGAYSYDGSGNIASITAGSFDEPGTGKSASLGSSFAYDGVGRLTSATVDGSSQTFAYDAAGNLKRLGGTQLKPDATTNRLAGSSYDGAGNQKAGPFGTLAYDILNMPIRRTTGSSTTRYLYGPGNERVATLRPDGSERWTVRNTANQVVRTYERPAGRAVWNVSRDYVHLPRGRATYDYDESGEHTGRRYHHVDHLGTTRLVTRAAGGGTFDSAKSFTAFGTELNLGWADDGEDHKFTGHERDDAQLDYMHARYYGPTLGRFLSVDPALGSAANPQSWNRYSYSGNNPLKNVDAGGESFTLAGGLIGGLVAGGTELAAQALGGELDWRRVGAKAARGAVTGALIGSVVDTGGASVPALLAAGVVANVAGGMTEAAVMGEAYTFGDFSLDVAWGVVGGAMASGSYAGGGGPPAARLSGIGPLTKGAPASEFRFGFTSGYRANVIGYQNNVKFAQAAGLRGMAYVNNYSASMQCGFCIGRAVGAADGQLAIRLGGGPITSTEQLYQMSGQLGGSHMVYELAKALAEDLSKENEDTIGNRVQF